MNVLAAQRLPTRIEAVVPARHPAWTRLELRLGVIPAAGSRSDWKEATMTKKDTRFKPGSSGNETAKWRPGQSGNPAGKSRGRARFEEAFTEALITGGGPEEAAKLLWEAARSKEPWAIQELCRRFSPQPQALHLIHEVDNDELDYTQLSDEELRQLDAIVEKASAERPSIESGESAPRAA